MAADVSDAVDTSQTGQADPEKSGPFDLAVIGGGLAGVCAALAAARQGATVALVNDRPVLGGSSSTEIRVPPVGAGDQLAWAKETGIVDELLTEERARSHDGSGYGMVNAHWDLVLYEACRAEPHLTLLQNTSVRAVELARPGRIAAVLGAQLGTEKRLRIAATLFLDASGDGTVAVEAGVPWRYGREARHEYDESLAPELADDETLGSSLLFHARNVGRPVPFTPPPWAAKYPDERSLSFRSHRDVEGGYWWIEVAYPLHTIRDNEAIRDELLRHVLGVWDHLKNHCVDKERAATYALDWVGMVPGKRESRRAVGAAVLAQSDLLRRELFWDRIGYGGWTIDDHERQGIDGRDRPPTKAIHVATYSVPLRNLIAGPAAENLFLAGRIMSASRIAFLSLRVQQTLAVLGQAAGTAAALCVARKLLPTQLAQAEVAEIQQRLLRQDCYVPHLRNEDPDDLARTARATASSEAALALEPDPAEGAAVEVRGQVGQAVPISAGRLEAADLYLENPTDRTPTARLRLLRARDLWDYDVFDGWRLADGFYGRAGPPPTAEELAHAEAVVPPGTAGWVPFRFAAASSEFRVPSSEPALAGANSEPGTRNSGRDATEPGAALVWLVLEPCPGLRWRLAADTPPGTVAVRPAAGPPPSITTEAWWAPPPGRMAGPNVSAGGRWRSLAVRLTPPSSPFGAQNVVNGISRPEAWPNVWISDPEVPLPQWLDLHMGGTRRIDTAILVFDTNFNRTRARTPALWHHPECVRDYVLAAWDGDAWRELVRVDGNYQRRRVHRFAPIETSRVRLTVLATNGVSTARVYDVRLYGGADQA